MSNWARRQLYVKRKKEPIKTEPIIDLNTGREEWENEFDREEMYNEGV